jgi:hypothetical protein
MIKCHFYFDLYLYRITIYYVNRSLAQLLGTSNLVLPASFQTEITEHENGGTKTRAKMFFRRLESNRHSVNGRETIYFAAWKGRLPWLTTHHWRNCVIRSAGFFTLVSKLPAWLVLNLASISSCLP